MTWNYRVIHRYYKETDIHGYGIHEVYYNKEGGIKNWSKDPISPSGESMAELKETLEKFARATQKRILVEKEDGERQILIEKQKPDSWNDFFLSGEKADPDFLKNRNDPIPDLSFESFKEQALQDPATKKEYDKLKSEFDALRKKVNILAQRARPWDNP